MPLEEGAVVPGTPTPASAATPEVNDAFDSIPDDIVEGMTVKAGNAEPPPAEPVAAPAAEPPAVAPPAPAAAAPVATPPATPAPVVSPATPAVPVVAAPVATPPPAPTEVQPNAVLETAEQRAAREKAHKDWQEAQVASLTDLYKLSEDDARQLTLEPEKVLPKLAARLHMDVLASIQRSLAETIPAHLTAHLTIQAQNKAAKDMLYGAWPKLNKPEFEGIVTEVGSMYRRTNKNATPEEAVKAIGRLAYAALGWPDETSSGAPPTPTPSPTPAARPFTPATPGGGGAAPRSPAPKNEFGDLAGDSPGSG